MDSSNYFILTEERKKRLFENAVIVFDTCSLCKMYFMTPDTLDTMVEVLDFFKQRIWIPAQVYYEYSKNREKAIKNPINECYNNISNLQKEDKVAVFTQIEEYISKVEERPDQHPFADVDKLSVIKAKLAEMKAVYGEIKANIEEQRTIRTTEINRLVRTDCLLSIIREFEKGTPFTHNDVLEIMREGKFRYEKKFPPGYMDENEKKKGSQIYGDLILWKEIIEMAKSKGVDVLFVTDDVKEDWYEDYSKKEGPTTPRHELIKEFQDLTNHDIWLFTLNQYVDMLIDNYKEVEGIPFYKGLEAVKNTLEYHRLLEQNKKSGQPDKLIVRCANCGEYFEILADDISWDWDASDCDEREMGYETHHICTHFDECPNCGNEVEIYFQVWEYPSGCFNTSEVEAEGVKIKRRFPLEDYIILEDYDTCIRCGQRAILNEDGYCDDCMEEFDRNVNSDD